MIANREWYRYAKEKKPLRVSTPIGLQRSTYYVSMPYRYGIPLMIIMIGLHGSLSQGLFVVPVDTLNSDGTIDTARLATYLGFSLWPLFTGMFTSYTFALSITGAKRWQCSEIAGLLILFMVIAIILCGFRRYTWGMPLGATFSAVISAACHQPLPDDRDAYMFSVWWRAVSHPQLDFDLAAQPRDTHLRDTAGSQASQQSLTGSSNHIELEELPVSEDCMTPQEKYLVKPGHCCFTTDIDAAAPIDGLKYA